MLVRILFSMVWYLCYLIRPIRFQYHLVFLDILNGIAEAKLKSTCAETLPCFTNISDRKVIRQELVHMDFTISR
jgi:hypothetical protein